MLKEGDNVYAKFGKYKILLSKKLVDRFKITDFNNHQFVMGVRPEDIYLKEEKATKTNNLLEVKVNFLEKLGNEILVYNECSGKDGDLCFRCKPRTDINEDDVISLMIDTEHIHLFEYDTEKTILNR